MGQELVDRGGVEDEGNIISDALMKLPDLVAVLNADGDIVWLNPAGHELLKRNLELEKVKFPLRLLWQKLGVWDMQGNSLARENFPTARLLRGETLISASTCIVGSKTHAGQDMYFQINGTPLYNSDGQKVIGAVIAAFDITETMQRKYDIEKLLAQNTLKWQELQGQMAHLRHFYLLVDGWAYAMKIMPDGTPRREWITPAFRRFTGYQVEELDRLGWEQLYHPDDRMLARESMVSKHTGIPGSVELRIITKGGEVRWMRDSYYPTIDEHDSSILWIHGAMQDISEQKQAQQQASEQQQRLEAVFDAITDGIILYDSDGELLMMNRALREMLAIDKYPEVEKLSSRERTALLNGRDFQGRPLLPEDWPNWQVTRGEILRGASTSDLWLTSLDGNELCVNVSGAPIYAASGQQTGSVMVIHDVLDRRAQQQRTEKTLATLLEMAEGLVDFPEDRSHEDALITRQQVVYRLLELTCDLVGSHAICIMTIEDGRIIPVAAIGLSSDLLHYFWNELAQTSLDDYFAEEEYQLLRAGEVIMLDASLPPAYKMPGVGKRQTLVAPMIIGEHFLGIVAVDAAGLERVFPLHEALMLYRTTGRLAALVIEREHLVEERMKAQANAIAEREANRQKDVFLSLASHELRTPLATIKGSIQLVRRKLQRVQDMETLKGTMKRVGEIMERAERQIAVEDRLVGDLLDVTRIQENRLTLRLKPCNLVEIVQRVVEDMQGAESVRQMRMCLSTNGPLVVNADAERIAQVLNNYLTNAIKYTPTETPIEIGIDASDRSVRVFVRDEGPGISREDQQHVWERFYQPRKRLVYNSKPGLGLGLYICQMIIQQHHGQVGVESAPDLGSTFWFVLPLSPA